MRWRSAVVVGVGVALGATLAGIPSAQAAPFASCDQARAAGAALLLAGEPGYSRTLDRDGDGVACEAPTSVPGRRACRAGETCGVDLSADSVRTAMAVCPTIRERAPTGTALPSTGTTTTVRRSRSR